MLIARVFIAVLSIVLVTICAVSSVAQAPENSSGIIGYLLIDSADDAAVVMAYGRALGSPATGPFALESGEVEVTLVEQEEGSWSPRRTVRALTIPERDTLRVTMNLPIRYRLDSIPPGAEFAIGSGGDREVLGTAPLILDRTEPIQGTLSVYLAGHLSDELTPGDSTFNRHTAILQPLTAADAVDGATKWVAPSQPRRWIDYAAASVALAAASVAVYYKFQADDYDDRYRSPDSLERGDPLLKDQAERMDLYSLGALGVMQGAITVLAVRLVLR